MHELCAGNCVKLYSCIFQMRSKVCNRNLRELHAGNLYIFDMRSKVCNRNMCMEVAPCEFCIFFECARKYATKMLNELHG